MVKLRAPCASLRTDIFYTYLYVPQSLMCPTLITRNSITEASKFSFEIHNEENFHNSLPSLNLK